MMTEKTFETQFGTIHYWLDRTHGASRPNLVFLPGLTADHHYFDKQVESLSHLYNIIVWDAPGHGASRPFVRLYSLADIARWAHLILIKEQWDMPVLIGQSMGGYVSQALMQLYPGTVRGFVSIDSSSLQRRYMTGFEIWLLKHTRLIYAPYPWKLLISQGPKSLSATSYGQQLMRQTWTSYPKRELYELIIHSYSILAKAVELNLPYVIDCPCQLICGEVDKAGSTRRYNEEWSRQAELPIAWIPEAGHNSNTDQPEMINALITKFVSNLETF